MNDDRFDALSKALAGSVSRRQALKVVAAAVAGGLLSTIAPRRAHAQCGGSCLFSGCPTGCICDFSNFNCVPIPPPCTGQTCSGGAGICECPPGFSCNSLNNCCEPCASGFNCGVGPAGCPTTCPAGFTCDCPGCSSSCCVPVPCPPPSTPCPAPPAACPEDTICQNGCCVTPPEECDSDDDNCDENEGDEEADAPQ